MTDQERPVEERNELLDDLLTAATAAVEEPDASRQASAAADEQPESAEQAAAPAAETAPTAVTDEGAPAPVAEAADAASSIEEEHPGAIAESQPADQQVERQEAAVAEEASAPVAEAEGASYPSVAEEVSAAASAPVAEAASAASSIGEEHPGAIAESQPADQQVERQEAASAAASAPVAEAASAASSIGEEHPGAIAESHPADQPVERQEAAVAEEASAAASAPVAEAEGASYTPVAEAASAPVAEAEGAPVAEAEGASYTPVAEEESGRPRRVKDLEPGMELEGRVTSIALYGVFVDLGVGRDGLVHISEMSDTRIDSPSDLVQIGDTVKVRVKSVEPDGRRISLTMRSKERAEPRGRGRKRPELNREALATLRVGDNVEGTVTGIAPFGVFVDIGIGKDGLVHVSELAEGRIEKPEDAVQVGQTYSFKILEVDAEGTRISLSLRRAQRGQRIQQIEKGQILEGKISGLAPFGAFVDVGVGRDGLVHISELAEGRIEKVEDAVQVGDTVKVRVLEVDSQSKRISLSMRLEDRPREAPAPRGEAMTEPREDRGRREDRGPRAPRQDVSSGEAAPDAYAVAEEPEDEFKGDATLEDLLSKFSGSKRDRRRRPEEEENEEDRFARRQRDAIRRTLQQMNDDE
jgi:small subunit ribosomal protein S1